MLTENTKPVSSSETLPGHRLRGRPPATENKQVYLWGAAGRGGWAWGGFTVGAGGCAVTRDVSTLGAALLLLL